MSSLDQAGMILYALKELLREQQDKHGRTYPTASEWQTINGAIAATEFEIDAPFSRGGMQEWRSTLDAALRLPK